MSKNHAGAGDLVNRLPETATGQTGECSPMGKYLTSDIAYIKDPERIIHSGLLRPRSSFIVQGLCPRHQHTKRLKFYRCIFRQGNLQHSNRRRVWQLFDQNHFPRFNIGTCGKFIDIGTAREVCGIPLNVIPAGMFRFIDECCHFPSENVVDFE